MKFLCILSGELPQLVFTKGRTLKHSVLSALAFLLLSGPLVAQTAAPVAAPDLPTIFIAAQPNFENALAAAFTKKQVPALITVDKTHALYSLEAADVFAHQESGGSKFARCLFFDCIGIEGTASTSVRLVRNADGVVVWAYQVRKANGGPVGIQSLSEAIAKHLKNDYLNKKKG